MHGKITTLRDIYKSISIILEDIYQHISIRFSTGLDALQILRRYLKYPLK